MLAREGARVAITGRDLARTQAAAQAIGARAGVEIEALAAPDNAARAQAIEGANVVLATGRRRRATARRGRVEGPTATWNCCATPTRRRRWASPASDMMDKGALKHGKTVFGAIGFGALKIALHRACIARLFEQNDLVLDAEDIHAIAKTMVG